MSFKSLLRTGDIVGEKFCYHDIPERLDPFDYETFAKSGTDFYVVCTNLKTGEAEYIQITDMQNQIDAMRASASMPYVSKIVDYKGKKVARTAGCADSIPVKEFQKMGYERNVVVLTREDGYEKKPQNARMADASVPAVIPGSWKPLKNRHRVYNQTLKEIHRDGKKTGDTFCDPSKREADHQPHGERSEGDTEGIRYRQERRGEPYRRSLPVDGSGRG